MTIILRLPLRAMRTRITLLVAQDTPDGLGGFQRLWVSGSQRWAYAVPQPDAARTRSRAPAGGKGRLRLVIRRQSGALPQRFRWRGEVYLVLQSHDVPEQDMQQWICEKI